MADLEFSIMIREPDIREALRTALKPFETRNRIQVNVTYLNWDTAWTELVKTALYGHGPDVSEVGSTWVGNLVAMNALRSFSDGDLAGFGGQAMFLPAAWQSGQQPLSPTQWGIPWMVDTRAFYYRRDWFQNAGIETASAFDSPAHLVQTLDQLAASGVELPWVMLTASTRVTLHNLASWVWGAGGDFMSADGKRILFDQPPAMAGMRAYFDLRRYFKAMKPDLSAPECERYFREGQAACMMSGPWTWLVGVVRQRLAAPEVVVSTGLAVPNTPFIGGSHLVMWQHAPRGAALDLIQYLTSPSVQAALGPACGLLPARTDVWKISPYGEAPLKQLEDRLKLGGRSFPAVSMWGLVEDKLMQALTEIWADILAAPNPDIDAILHAHIDPLAQRLNVTLGR